MRQHARKILAPAFITVVSLGLLAGAEPAGPEPDRLTVEGLKDGQIQIRHESPGKEPVDIKVERLGDGRFRLTGVAGAVTCKAFHLGADGKSHYSGDVEMGGEGFSVKADEISFCPSRRDSEKLKARATDPKR